MPPSLNDSHGEESHNEKPKGENPEVEDLNTSVSLDNNASFAPTPDATLPADIDLAATVMEEWKSALGDEVDPGQTIKMPSPESDGLDKTVRLSDELNATQQVPSGTASDDDFVVGVGYEVDQLLGEGGMGAVYAGRQQSMDRPVAIKVLKSKLEQIDGSQQAFTSEAIITGGLDHPNIVPIYDLGKQEDEALFYAMKQVEGVEWKDRIGTNSISENLDILLRVADAVAFAHARCIIHRDLKPANIMLGSFGEVLVMDWGLAMPTQDHPRREVYHTPAPGGTPYYMAPEMLNGVEQVDRRSDVYLLGGILFEMITGKAPHTLDAPPETQREQVVACLAAVSQNVIAETEKSGELLEIARNALATDPADRYQSVPEFQQAIRGYLSHEESIELAARATDRLEAARKNGDYDEFSRARFGFETALEEWPENGRAIEGLKATKYDYAKTALDRGDLDLGLSLLDETDAEHSKLRSSIQAAIVKRDARQQQVRRLKRVAFGASVVVAIVASVATVWINSERDKALAAQDKALAAQKEEAIQREQAQSSADEAQAQRLVAIAASERAEEEREKAVAAQKIAQENEQKAMVAEARAKQEAENALRNFKVAERNAYYSDMLLLQKAWQDSDIANLQVILNRYRRRQDLRGFEWDYWSRMASDGLLGVREHSDSINDITFSPDGTRMASASQDKTVQVWDIAAEKLIFTLKGHTASVNSVAFSPDASRLATASSDGLVKVWDAVNGKESGSYKRHINAVNNVKFSPDGKWLASAGNDRTVKLWDSITGKEKLTFKGHSQHVLGLAFHPQGKWLASSGRDNTVKLWDTVTGKVLFTFKGHSDTVRCISFSSDGRQLASAGWDGNIKLWDTNTGKAGLTIKVGSRRVNSVAFSPDGRQLVSAGWDRLLKLWDIASGEEVLRLKGHTHSLTSVAFSPDGTRLISADVARVVKLWSRAGEQESLTLNKHKNFVTDITFSADGTRLASASRDGTIKLWDPGSGQETRTLNGHSSWVRSVSLNAEGTRLASGDKSGTVKIWDTVAGKEILSFAAHKGALIRLLISPDGTQLASTGKDGLIKIWNIDTGQLIHTFKGHTRQVSDITFSPDGTRLASAVKAGTIKVWDVINGTEMHTIKLPKGNQLNSLAFSPDGTQFASAMSAGKLKVWDSTTGKEILTMKGHAGVVRAVAFSPDGRRLASAGQDQMIKVWDATTGQEALTLKGHTDVIVRLIFSPDGKRLVSASPDKTLKVWDTRPWTDKLRAESYARGMLTTLRERVNSLEALQKRITEDKTLSDPVRKQALEWAELFWENRETPIRRKPKSGK